jgi:hypothetical protein
MRAILPIVLVVLLKTMLLQAAQPIIPPDQLPPKEKFKIYLLMGQSNMAGHGAPSKVDLTPHPRVLVMSPTGIWRRAVEPITREPGFTSGVGPGLAFGKVMADADPDVTIGLVPAPKNGTGLVRFEKGHSLYAVALSRAQIAMESGTLAGVLWHQGEADSKAATNALTYEARLTQMISDLRADVGNPDLPFVVGELGQFYINRSRGPKYPLAKVVDAALLDIPNTVPMTGCASSARLTHIGDETHFDAPSQRALGKRYAAIMLTLEQYLQLPQGELAQ